MQKLILILEKHSFNGLLYQFKFRNIDVEQI